MTLWMRWKHLISDLVGLAGNRDLDVTRVIDCSRTDLRVTKVMDCQPTVEVRRCGDTWECLHRQEKRVHVRYPCDRPILCRRPESTADFFPGRTRNLSLTGVGFIVPRKVDVGSLLIVAVGGVTVVQELSVRVIHARPLPICGWFLGGELARPLVTDQLRALI